ncbi:MAG: hypothetical protein LBL66_09670 [Clostridiales bacterium]|jgi:alanyl-tRNA synthetase|nr:hypothetical protein [Clostridiales bacterium]
MRKLTSAQLRELWAGFFSARDHAVIGSSSLIPENDPTVLFTTAGMHPLVPYLLGQKHPAGKRLANVQKCVRTGDIDDVGDNRHCTFFEMLGNWSLGDYFKADMIRWSYEFLTGKDTLGIPVGKLAVSVFAGDADAPRDDESARLWEACGVPKDKIFYLPKQHNWWGPAGRTGPCGPDTEMFIDTGAEPCGPDCSPACGCGKYIEIWNDVFMQYFKGADGRFSPLAQRNVDTGMGLERTLCILNGYESVYETDLFAPIIEELERLSGKKYFGSAQLHSPQCTVHSPQLKDKSNAQLKDGVIHAERNGDEKNKSETVDCALCTVDCENSPDNTSQFSILNSQLTKAFRVVADHLRTSVFMLGDERGIVPSNVDQGYVLRRLIRRAVRYGRQLGLPRNALSAASGAVVKIYAGAYPEIAANAAKIAEQLKLEEERFEKTLTAGLKEFEKAAAGANGKIDGQTAFHLYDTYGFPLEMTVELAAERNIEVDAAGFDTAFAAHQSISQAGSEQRFKGGLADASADTAALHTATHLLHAALRRVLSDTVEQRGSNITAERLRFDFCFPRKVEPDELRAAEKLVNEAIAAAYPIVCEEMTVDEAKASGAIGIFTHKYGDRVKVYTMGPFSKEICGGPHAANTGDLGVFAITKEESSSAGVRRIKAELRGRE